MQLAEAQISHIKGLQPLGNNGRLGIGWGKSTIRFEGNRPIPPRESHSIAPEPPKIFTGPEVFSSLLAAQESIRIAILEWAEGNKDLLVISLDGYPGSGKSTYVQFIEDAARTMKIPILTCPVDMFMNTARESILRELKNTLPQELFDALFSCRQSIAATLLGAQMFGQQAGTIHYERSYDRPTGQIVPGSLWIPEGRKVVLLEGVGAIGHVLDHVDPSMADALNIFIDLDPADAIQRAVRRDVAAKGTSPQKAIAYRAAETLKLAREMERNRTMADMLIRA